VRQHWRSHPLPTAWSFAGVAAASGFVTARLTPWLSWRQQFARTVLRTPRPGPIEWQVSDLETAPGGDSSGVDSAWSYWHGDRASSRAAESAAPAPNRGFTTTILGDAEHQAAAQRTASEHFASPLPSARIRTPLFGSKESGSDRQPSPPPSPMNPVATQSLPVEPVTPITSDVGSPESANAASPQIRAFPVAQVSRRRPATTEEHVQRSLPKPQVQAPTARRMGDFYSLSDDSALSRRELIPSLQRALPAPSETNNALHELIESVTTPVPMPGLKVRLFSPSVEPQATFARLPRSPGEEQQRESKPEVPAASQHPPAGEPRIDINAVADKVYETLTRRQQFERERKGLY